MFNFVVLNIFSSLFTGIKPILCVGLELYLLARTLQQQSNFLTGKQTCSEMVEESKVQLAPVVVMQRWDVYEHSGVSAQDGCGCVCVCVCCSG